MFPEVSFIQDGWPGAIGFPLPGAARGCGCGSFPPPFPPARHCGPIELPPIDSANVIYHLFNNQLSNLTNLGFPNGTPAQIIFDGIDQWIGTLKVSNWSIPTLRALFPAIQINFLPQFGTAVDTEFANIITSLNLISGATLTPLSATNTPSITFNLSGAFNKNISAVVNISAQSGQTLVLLSDGLFATPQQLTINYLSNEIGITGGNTVQLPNAPVGYLGNVPADPSNAVDGNTWYNTSSLQYKVKVNGSIHVITIS